MNGSEQRSFRARLDELAPALAFVDAFCGRHGVAPSDAARLTLVVEELFTNTVVHGHRGGADTPLHIALGAAPGALSLDYEDSAPPFDPLQYLRESASDPAAPVTEGEPGGYGLPLVARMAEQMDYEHRDGRNRLRLRLKRGA